MLQLSFIRKNRQLIIERLLVKNFDASVLVDDIITLDEQWRKTKKELDDTLMHLKLISKGINGLVKSGKEFDEKRKESIQLKQSSKDMENKMRELSELINKKLVELPNLPHKSVPYGETSQDNEIILKEGDVPVLPVDALPHWELSSKYNIINFDVGAKVTGSGFPFYRGEGARLQRALIGFFLDEALKNGYTEYQVPLLINQDSGFGTGQIPDKEGQMYFIGEDNFYLIPTAEVPLTNIYRNMILSENDLPIKNVAYSSCFRREAGSYGKDVRGLNRLHQFDKVEIVQIAQPDISYDVLEEMKEQVANLLRKLELPFRIVKLCGGDISFTSALTYDFEVYSAAQKRWLEVSSVSNFESFQSNRMKLRIKNKKGQIYFAHTLNGSALALPRVMAALLENNQTSNGIIIPEVLRHYTGFDKIK